MSNKNLLLMIIDTSPALWSLYETSISKNPAHNIGESNTKFTVTDFLNSCIGFINAYVSMNQDNAVVLIAAHNFKAEYLYPTKTKRNDKLVSPWNRCEQITDINDQIKKNFELLVSNEEIESRNTLPLNNSTLTSAFGLALCYVNRIQKCFQLNQDSTNYRVLIVKLFEDAANQYMNFMNMIFTSEKLNIPIDSCVLLRDSSLLQQASNLTNGVYFKVPQITGLLHYLLWIFLPNEKLRKMLVSIPKSHVDFRAACFCHRQLIDIGFVCSVCLSVFCSFTPICTTCDCNFEFDLNILKIGKTIDLKKSSQLSSITSESRTASNISTNSVQEINRQSETRKPQITTSIISVSSISNAHPPHLNARGSSNNQNVSDDSFDMLD